MTTAPAQIEFADGAAQQHRPTLRRYTPDDWRAVVAAAQADGAEVVAPTHVIEQGGKVVGYGSVGRLGMIGGWLHREVSEPATFATLRVLENAAELNGADVFVMACTEDCRMRPLMERAGYTAGAPVTLFYKKAR